jgi:hypothetical protein
MQRQRRYLTRGKEYVRYYRPGGEKKYGSIYREETRKKLVKGTIKNSGQDVQRRDEEQ